MLWNVSFYKVMNLTLDKITIIIRDFDFNQILTYMREFSSTEKGETEIFANVIWVWYT